MLYLHRIAERERNPFRLSGILKWLNFRVPFPGAAGLQRPLGAILLWTQMPTERLPVAQEGKSCMAASVPASPEPLLPVSQLKISRSHGWGSDIGGGGGEWACSHPFSEVEARRCGAQRHQDPRTGAGSCVLCTLATEEKWWRGPTGGVKRFRAPCSRARTESPP